jgi:hypothetical protein
MLPASTNAGGMGTANVPDVCKTPTPGGPVPMPYPNVAQCTMAVKTAIKVMFTNRPVLHVMSEVPMSSGDEAGSAGGGVKSNTFIDKMTYVRGSSKVQIEGQPVVFLTANTMHNGANANITGLHAAPSQTNVMVSP